jgi:uncharacterized membrane protein
VLQGSLLGDHFAPAEFLFAPLYRLIATPAWLLVAQVGAVFYAALRLAFRLRATLGMVGAALGGVLLISYPSVSYGLLNDFHSSVLAAPFGFLALLATDERDMREATVWGLLAAGLRVEVGLAVFIGMLVWPGSVRNRRLALSLVGGYLLVALVLDQLLVTGDYWGAHYGYLGAGVTDALLHPWRVVSALVSVDVLAKALPWVAGTGFLCFRRPRLAIPGLVVALPVLLSHWPGTDALTNQYGAAPVLLLVMCVLCQVEARKDFAVVVLAAAGFLTLTLGPFTPAFLYGRVPFIVSYASSSTGNFLAQSWRSTDLHCLTEQIPPGAGVSALVEPLTLLSHRTVAYWLPFPFDPIPASALRDDPLQHPDPGLRVGVDYLISAPSAPESVSLSDNDKFVKTFTGHDYSILTRSSLPQTPFVRCG